MPKLLDLYITHWNEPWEVGRKGFEMLAMQKGVPWDDVNITLVHDGSEAFPESCFEHCPFTVNQVCLPHGGIAKARNWCIENGDATWIKWNDFDDSFAGLFSLKDMINILPADDYDLIWFPMYWDVFGRDLYIRRERECIFVHNKMIRREFLMQNQIRFVEDLIWCEDSAFFADIEMLIDGKRIGKINSASIIYCYSCREGSLCNRPEIKFANLQSFFRRHTYVAEQFKKRGLLDQYYTMCVRVMGDSYYTCRRAPIPDDRTEHEKRVWEWFDKHRDAFYACRPEMIGPVLLAVNRENFDGGIITEKQMMEWIHEHERSEENGDTNS